MSPPPLRPPPPPTPPSRPGQPTTRPQPGPATRPGDGTRTTGGGRATTQAPKVDYGPLLDRLANDIEQMNLEYEKYFNGGLPVPPAPMRSRVEAQLKQLRNVQGMNAVERFRMSSLEARFTSFSELYNRRLREKEEGRRPRAATPTRPVPRHDATQGITFGRELDPDALEALFAGLHRNNPTPPRFDLDSFGNYLRGQLAAIQQRTGCTEVQFRVATEDGKLKLKARPLPAGSRVP
jgi:hypothetical protein